MKTLVFLLRGTKREDVERGQVLAKPGQSRRIRSLKVRFTFCRKTKVVATRHFSRVTAAVLTFETTDVTGSCELPEGTEMVMPGDNVLMDVELIAPIAMEEGQRFAIREGGRTVGAGVVAKIKD